MTNRLKIINCSPQFLIMIMQFGCKYPVRVINPLPSDAAIIRAFQGGDFNSYSLVIHSMEFPELKDGDPIPEMQSPQFEEVR